MMFVLTSEPFSLVVPYTKVDLRDTVPLATFITAAAAALFIVLQLGKALWTLGRW